MDFKSMKRKDLQALCKQHGIRANSTNSEMIRSLSSVSQIGEKAKPRGCLKGSGGSSGEELGVLRGGSKKVTFVFEDEEGSEYEEFARRPGGKSKRKSVGRRRRSSVALWVGKGSKEVEEESVSESVGGVSEVPRRSTRSRGLAEVVVWSRVIGKKKKSKSKYGTEGVRCNVEEVSDGEGKGSVVEVDTTRSLRNRVVVVGGDEGIVNDKSTKRSLKRNTSEKELKKDDAEKKRNLRKRSRNGDSVEEEPPLRRLTRNQAKSGEFLATEEDDVGRSKKRRKRDLEFSIDKGVDKEVERVSTPAITTKKARGDQANSWNVLLDSVVVTEPVRRSTRSSSNILEDRISLQVVRKSVKEKKNTSRKQLKDTEVVAVPTRRTTRSSATLMEDGTSLPVFEKSVKGEAVRKGKSQKHGKVSAPLPNCEAVIESVRRTTSSSSTLVEDGASLTVVEKSVKEGEAIKKGKYQKQGKVATSLPNSGVVTEPIRRTTRSSSTLVEDGTSLLTEVARKLKSQKEAKDCALGREDFTASLPGNKSVTEPTRRSTRSSKLLEGETSSASKQGDKETVITPERRLTRSSSKSSEDGLSAPAFGKLGGDNDSVGKDTSGKQETNHALKSGDLMTSLLYDKVVTTTTSRSTRSSVQRDMAASSPVKDAVITPTRRSNLSSSKGLEDVSAASAVRRDKSGKQATESDLKGSASTASSPVIEAVTTPTKRSTRSSLNLSEGRTSVEVEKLGDEKSLSLLDSPTVTEFTRRSTHSSTKGLEDVSVTSAVRKDNSVKKATESAYKGCSLTAPSPVIEAVTTPTRTSTRSSLKLSEGGTSVEVETLGDEKSASLLDSPTVSDTTRRSTRSSSRLNLFKSPSVRVKLGDDDEPVQKKKSGKQTRVLSSRGRATPRSEVERVYGEVQRHTTSKSEVESENLLPIGENLGDEAEIVERNKQTEEVDGGLKDMMTGNEVTQVTNSLSPCKISEVLTPASDTEDFPAIDLEKPNPIGEIHNASVDGPSLVHKSSEGLSLTFKAEASLEIDLENPDSKGEVDDEDATNITDETTLDIKICSEFNVEERNSKLEDDDASKGDVEGIASETPHHSNSIPVVARDFSGKVVEVSTEAVSDARDLFNLQRTFLNEIESCKSSEECSNVNEIENEENRHNGEVSPSLRKGSSSFDHLCPLDQVKEHGSLLSVTSVESLENAPSFIANVSSMHDGVSIEEHEREAAMGPISPSVGPALGLISADQVKENCVQSSPEMILDNATTNGFHGNEKESDSIEMPVEGREACMYKIEPTDAERNLLKDTEYSSPNLAEVCCEITEGKSSDDCRNVYLSPQSSGEPLKQMEVAVKNLPTLRPSIGSEENMPMGGTDAPAILGNEGSTEKEDIIPVQSVEMDDEEQIDNESAKEDTRNSEEFPSSVSLFPLANFQESEATHTSNKEGFSAATDMAGLSPQSDDENEVGEKLELPLPCNVHEELDVQKEADEKDSAEVSLLKFECLSEAKAMIPVDISECKEATKDESSMLGGVNLVDKHEEGNATAVSEPTIEDFDNADTDNNVDQNKNLDLGSKMDEASPVADQPLVGLQRETGSCIRESTSTVVTGQAEERMHSFSSQFDYKTSEDDDATRCIVSSGNKLDFRGFDETAGSNNRYGFDIARGSDNSEESKCRDKFESFEQTSSVAEAWDEPGASTIFAAELFQMDSEVAGFANNDTQVGQWECRFSEDSFARGECESFMEVSATETLPIRENDKCEMPFKDGSLSSSSLEHYLRTDCRDSGLISLEKNLSQEMNDVNGNEEVYSSRQYKPQEQRKISIQEASDVSRSTEDEIVTGLDGSKIEGSVTVQARLEESTLKQQKVRPYINEAEDSESIKALFTSQDTFISSKIATVRSGSTSKTQESKTSEKQTLANKKSIEDLCLSGLNALPNDFPKSAMDVNKEQNKIEDIKEGAQSTASAGSCKPYSLIDDATKNKENTVGLKMGSSLKHTEKSTARRPLQRVRKTEDID